MGPGRQAPVGPPSERERQVSVTVLWYKRDLRVSDHPALALAASREHPVLPLYIIEPELWAEPDASARQWEFVAESLGELARDLAALGAPLHIATGDAVDALKALHDTHGLAGLVSHQETGNLWTFARDRRVAAWAAEKGIPWDEPCQSGVVRRLPHRDGWSKARDGFVFAAQVPKPKALRGVPVETPRLPEGRALGLAPDGIQTRQRGGRSHALTLLDSFLTERGQSYRRAMSSPLTGEDACSRLSPHFAWGTLTVREAALATAIRQSAVRGTRDGWIGSLKSFQARLAWRDHFTQKLEDEPELERRAMHPAYERLRPATPDPARLAAWEAGETGVPFVDACMRYLTATGWLNFRMRSMLVAFASYHLWLDWRATGPILARRFTDYEPGIHWPQMQMQSGVTGMNTVRIYNPLKQGADQDPDGEFTRRWLPELRDVPDALLQTPWRWEGGGGLRYPPPIVDVAEAARAARERVWAVRRKDGFRAEAARIVDKHASRKDARFVNDRAPKARKGRDPRQLSLDV